ncbi:MAG: hypothetical protein WD208_09890 [Dehalococcoidia bacterium]
MYPPNASPGGSRSSRFRRLRPRRMTARGLLISIVLVILIFLAIGLAIAMFDAGQG